MKRWIIVLAGCLGAVTAFGGDLEGGFANPPDSARPHTWWHWMNGNVSREGITADLEAMARVGVGGAQIFNVSENIPDGPAPFMSPQWLDLVRHAAAEADRLGIELCFHNCAGWSSSGGPWITPDHAMQILTFSETAAKGPAKFDAVLAQPQTRKDYYRDIAVLAFPTPADPARVADIRPKAVFDSRYGLTPQPVEVPAGACVPRDRIVDLTAQLAPDGRLAWEVPAGDWTILRIGHTPTGKDNHPSPEAGRGLECDKLSREALDAHWAGGIEPILKKLGPLAGKSLNNSLIDSYEVGCNNWTPKFREEFQRRRGYDPIPFLPAVAGRFVDGSEVTERFLWDFRRTIGDLFAENYYDYFCELCRAHGLKASIEPYDGPFECLQVGAKADILMGEFWVGGGEPSSVKLAAAAAHVHGIGIVGAESFTSVPDRGKWQNHPGGIKALGDLMWCAGINRFIFHRYAHQPWLDKFPGMTMGQWGTHFERTNTWWEQARAWMKYLARSQYMLQSGRFAADVLFFGGEAAPNGMPHRTDLKAMGHDYDAFGTDLIAALTVKDGRVVTPGGTSYRVLALPDSPWMTPALARKVRELVKAGATVVARKPSKSPSLAGFPACDDEIRALADEVWGAGALPAAGEHALGAGRVVWGRPVEDVLDAAGVAPDVETTAAGAKLAWIHRVVDGADVYFVSNQKPQGGVFECVFRTKDRRPELWNPETGAIAHAPLWRTAGDRTAVTLDLEQAGSVFVVFRDPASAGADPACGLAFERAAPPPPRGPAPKLEIRKAVYGPAASGDRGMVDVSEQVAAAVKDGRLNLRASNDLAGDPAGGVVKEMRVVYEIGGVTNLRVAGENQMLSLPAKGDPAGVVKVLRAAYGKFDARQPGVPVIGSIDATERVRALVKDGLLEAVANNALAGGDPAYLVPKQLQIAYAVDGVGRSLVVQENAEFRLPEDAWSVSAPRPLLAAAKDGGLRLTAWEPGRYAVARASGASSTVEVASVPTPVEVTGPWDVEFRSPVGAPPKTTFAKLISWPDHESAAIRYFSGTATYRTTFQVPPSMIGDGRVLQLDLGQVKVIAEVKLNGRDLGILWKAPFRADLTGVVRPGANELDVRVTNLWPNRLIGDEEYPDDCTWRGITIARWPDWMVQGTERPSKERVTFTTWKHWKKGAALLPSGLLGPVTVRAGVEIGVK